MSKDQVAKKETELKDRIEAYQKEAGAAQQALMRVQQERGREIMGPARKAVDAVAKQKKLSLVMESGQTGLLFTDDALDITDSVIKQMDASNQ
jgi:outer membrane protein